MVTVYKRHLSLLGIHTSALLSTAYSLRTRHSRLQPLKRVVFQVPQLRKQLCTQARKAQPLSMDDIRKATSDFDKKIGEGGFGPVYYGRLEDGQEVAVKVLATSSKQGIQEYQNELRILSMVDHKHVVSLLGYCEASENHILVYEYMRGGDLAERLGGKAARSNPLTWKERKRIMMEVAEALQYLHKGSSSCVIHWDIKSKNILLTDQTSSKLADFGLSRLRDDLRDEQGINIIKSINHVSDPEYMMTKKITEKSDVYAFGQLMLEMMCGRGRLVRSMPAYASKKDMYLADYVRYAWKSETVKEIADPNMRGDFELGTLYKMVPLALWCVEFYSRRRPSMTQVVQQLVQMGLGTSTLVKETAA